MSLDQDMLGFEGVPFDPLAGQPAVQAANPEPAPAQARPAAAPVPAAAGFTAQVLAELRAGILAAHISASRVQTTWQEQALTALRSGRPVPAPTHPVGAARQDPAPARALAPAPTPLDLRPVGFRPEGGLEPLTPAVVTALDARALDLLGRGEIVAALGPAHARTDPPRLDDGPLRSVTELRAGGAAGVAVLRGTCAAPADAEDLSALGRQVAEVLALWLGLHTCVPAAGFRTGPAPVVVPGPPASGEHEVVAEVTDGGLVPRPWLRIDLDVPGSGHLRGLVVEVREADGTPLGTRRGGNPPALPTRRGVTGELAIVDELALATASVGDLTLALGPEFERYTSRRATRPPAGGLRLVGRVMSVQGTRGDLSPGAVGETEYDSVADAWYYGAAPSPTVPNVVLMETSLQSALLLGYHLGATLTDPGEDYSLRNLDGSATLHREVDLRGRTIRQRSELLSTTVLSGAVLQSFAYALWLDGEDRDTVEPFYSGRSLFGFFNASALANQAGLDNGEYVPTWLDGEPAAKVRTVDVAGRTGAAGHAVGELDLVRSLEVVDGGGRHAHGYVRGSRPVAAGDWFFARHFHLDPVMPGSLGIEAVIQALQEWLVDTGALDELSEPEFVVPTGVELGWRYRGQILAGDGLMTLEVHVKEVERRSGRVRVVADASVWKPGLRIYELTDVAAEARSKGAPSW